jgi:putative PIN family toxin of toxin-antitoxin system
VPSAVLDTNVIVSGTLVPKGIPFELLKAWRTGAWELIISPHILEEVRRVLTFPRIARDYALTAQDVSDVIWLFTHRAILMPGRLTIPRTARDPEDDPILACALEGRADYIVSGDQDLLSLTRVEGIPIITPAAFATILIAPR